MQIHSTIRTALFLFAIIAVSSTARADIPRTISYSGVLSDAAGHPLADGSYQITFGLYDALSGGNQLWTETKQVTVSGGKGAFQTALGDTTPFGALAFNLPYFLRIQVGNDPPMTPRAALLSAPYALSAGSSILTLPFSGSANVAGQGSALSITNTGTGHGIYGYAGSSGIGVYGESASFEGVRGTSHNINHGGVVGVNTAGGDAIFGTSNTGQGLEGGSVSSSGVAGYSTSWIGTYGFSANSDGVWGRSTNSNGVYGLSDSNGIGVYGESAGDEGVRGTSHNVNHGGVVGVNTAGGTAVYGTSNGAGVAGYSTGWIGTYGESNVFDGVQGVSHAVGHAGASGINTVAGGWGIYGRADGGYAGWFDGLVHVNVLEVAGGSDLAEKFNVSEKAEPGTVMAIDVDHPGKLRVARGAYDDTVAGVISGANRLSAGVVLPDADTSGDALPLAMSGRAWVKCDASYGAIRPGDLLTTSDTPGCAMKVTDHARAMGATVGKAMTALPDGRGLVLALVNLQ